MLSSSNGFKTSSRTTKFDQSTVDDIRFKNSGEKFNSKEKQSTEKSFTKRSPDNEKERIYSKFYENSESYQKLSNFHVRQSRYENKEKEEG